MPEIAEPLHLPHFQEALAAYKKELAAGTYSRYRNGIMPGFVRWLVQHPELVKAFCNDVTEIHQQPPDKAA